MSKQHKPTNQKANFERSPEQAQYIISWYFKPFMHIKCTAGIDGRSLLIFSSGYAYATGPKAGMPLVGHADANRHALLNIRNILMYSTCRLCQQTQTFNLLVVVQGQCTMGCAADESGMEGGFSAP
jgi:hypothetical protein